MVAQILSFLLLVSGGSGLCPIHPMAHNHSVLGSSSFPCPSPRAHHDPRGTPATSLALLLASSRVCHILKEVPQFLLIFTTAQHSHWVTVLLCQAHGQSSASCQSLITSHVPKWAQPNQRSPALSRLAFSSEKHFQVFL